MDGGDRSSNATVAGRGGDGGKALVFQREGWQDLVTNQTQVVRDRKELKMGQKSLGGETARLPRTELQKEQVCRKDEKD